MNISAKEVNKLRQATGAGMMDCKKALVEAEGNFDEAIAILRKKGQKVSEKRADREAKEGVIATAITGDKKMAVITEVNCETDFVARNEEFQAFAQAVADLVLATQPDNMETLLTTPMGDITLAEKLNEMTGKIGEKIDVRRFEKAVATGSVVSYIHPGARLGVLVELTAENEEVGRDVAMQVAALDPITLNADQVSEEIKQREMTIARDRAINEGKPENIVDRIAQGALNSFFKERVLLDQPFVKDPKQTVAQVLKKANVDVVKFVRFVLGG
ncbi:MAG: elongation factor Ts [Bacteroidetes Order II. Incertae sedis bacterium]|nr:elongation factor Ts [Bacteroidetes Order II. bacterium]